MSKTIIISNLTFSYKGQIDAAINGLSCDMPCDGIVAIIGKSGSGKSTLLRLISGVYRKHDRWSGHYTGDLSICEHKPHELKGPELVSLMGSHPFLMNNLSVKQNILLPCDLMSESARTTSYDYYKELIEFLEFSKQEHCRPMELSSGMKTRVAFARAMISRPQYLFLDEPYTSLDIIMRWRMYKAIRKTRTSDNFTTLITTHDLWEAAILANWIIVLVRQKNGKTKVTPYKNTIPEISNCSITECLRTIQTNVENISKYLDNDN